MGKEATVATTSQAFDNMFPRWELVETLRGGTEAMRKAGSRYLPMETEEEQSAYNVRLERSFLFPAYARTIQGLVGKVFAEPVQLEEESVEEDVASWMENVDLSGRDLHTFARDVFEAALDHGLTHIHVDYPKVTKGITLADERTAGLRPYLRHVKASDVIFWWSETINGKETLLEVRIRETARVREGNWGEETRERIRVLRPGMYELHEKTTDKSGRNTWTVIERSLVSLTGVIPWITVYTERTDFMEAKPPLMGLANLNVAHWQSSSDQRNILRIARVPFIFAKGVSKSELGERITISSNRLLAVKSADADMKFVEHSGAAIAAGKADLDDLKEEMAAMGLELLVRRPGNETATGRAIDSAEMNSALAAMAKALGNALQEAIKFMGRWVGRDLAPEIKVNTDLGLSPEDATAVNALIQARASKDISRDTFWTELRRRGILSENFDFATEKLRLLAEDAGTMDDLPDLVEEEEEPAEPGAGEIEPDADAGEVA